MCKSAASFVVTTLLFCSLALSAQASSRLNGLASHQELGSEQFIGALYLETASDSAQAILNASGSKRMEVRIVADQGIASRRFSRMWIEGVAINNSGDVLNSQADNMVRFSNLLRDRLHRNDVLAITLHPGDGVDIDLNGVKLDRIEDDAFFNVLLRTWIGRVPLSSTFRRQLLQPDNVNPELQARFDAIAPSPERVAAIDEWNRPEPEPEPEPPTKPEPAPTQTVSRQALGVGAPLVTAVELPQVSLASDPEPEPEPEPEVKSEPEPEPEPAVAEEEEDDEPRLTAESLRAQQVYFSDLMRSILRNTEYPRRSLQRGQEGEIRVAVAIDRSGDIRNMEILEESPYSLLNREAERAIRKAAPFPDVPEVIRGEVYEFSVPFTFVVPD